MHEEVLYKGPSRTEPRFYKLYPGSNANKCQSSSELTPSLRGYGVLSVHLKNTYSKRCQTMSTGCHRGPVYNRWMEQRLAVCVCVFIMLISPFSMLYICLNSNTDNCGCICMSIKLSLCLRRSCFSKVTNQKTSACVYVYVCVQHSALRQKADVGDVLKDSLVDNQPAISEVCGSSTPGLWRISLVNPSSWTSGYITLIERLQKHTSTDNKWVKRVTLFWRLTLFFPHEVSYDRGLLCFLLSSKGL